MELGFCSRLQLFTAILCCLTIAQLTSSTTAEFQVSSTTTETATMGTPGILSDEIQENPEECYVEKSRVSELLVSMNKTVRFLNKADKFLECRDKLKVVEMDLSVVEICSETRVAKIQEELDEVAGELFQMAAGISKLSQEEYDILDSRKFRLVRNLNALRVFYGPSPCDPTSIVVYPTGPLVEYVEWNMEQILTLFQSTRPQLHRAVTPKTTPPKPTIDDMLDSKKDLLDLREMAQLNPEAMSKALPQIISQRYNERLSTFDVLLNFTESLTTTGNRIHGLAALFDEMHRYNRNPEAFKMIEVAKRVENLQKDAATNSSRLETSSQSKLFDLANDPQLRPLLLILKPRNSDQELTELAHPNSATTSKQIVEIVSQRYSGSDSDLNALLDFVPNLPTAEDQIIWLGAICSEIQQNTKLSLDQGLKLAMHAKPLRHPAQRRSTTKSDAATVSLFDAVVRALSALILIGEKSECVITNVAHQMQLMTSDAGWPESAYVLPTSYWLRIYPIMKDNSFVFRILWGESPLYASDSNPNTHSNDLIYQKKSSERYVLRNKLSNLPAGAEVDWKITPTDSNPSQFRILSAKSDDFLFVHKSATVQSDLRGSLRVILGKNDYAHSDYLPNGDLWTLNCKPGIYNITSF